VDGEEVRVRGKAGLAASSFDVRVDPNEPLLSVSGLRRVLGGRHVLSGVDLQVARGEAVAVVGPNGSGKTTLLRCVLGTDRCNGGTLRFCGEPLVAGGARERSGIAAALDDVDFFGDLSIAEHVALLAAAHGDADPDRLARTLLGEAALAAAADQLPVTLSSGQRRRLALLTCFARPRLLVVLDEPEQRLDRAGRRWLITRLQQEKRLGHGVLISTHDRQLIAELADRVVDLGTRE
jgi:ABC-type multidrug transport system ATPase subunit